ncbi:MAG: MFS transporter [Proteobacteria bacterium]|nr:MAG: MFS transporter [Pseudomonadota bacterium]
MTHEANNSHARTVFVFSSAGHFFVHLCIAFYFVIVLSLEDSWDMPYHELVSLWTLGSLMVGVAALPAGLLADRLGAPAIMVVFFIGMGASAIAAGLSNGSAALLVWLSAIGLFAAVYHPVGIPWLVRNVRGARGKALALNGIFGSFGGAAAGLVSGFLIDAVNWRAAFIVPGAIIMLTGLAMAWLMWRGRRLDCEVPDDEKPEGGAPKARVFGLLMVSMFIGGLLFNGTQTALPKVFELRHQGLAGDGLLGIGFLVALVYVMAGFMQLVGGHMADRYPLKTVYATSVGLQAPLLWLAAQSGGATLLVVATLMVMANVSALPAENMILARYAPSRRHGLAFGAKFVLAFGAAPVGVQLVSAIQDRTGDLALLFQCFAILAVLALVVVTRLPALSRTRSDARQPASA